MPDEKSTEMNDDAGDKRAKHPDNESALGSKGTAAANTTQTPADAKQTVESTDTDPAEGQKGQPGLNDPDHGDWSPSAVHSES